MYVVQLPYGVGYMQLSSIAIAVSRATVINERYCTAVASLRAPDTGCCWVWLYSAIYGVDLFFNNRFKEVRCPCRAHTARFTAPPRWCSHT